MKAERDILRESGGLLREGLDMRFAFVAKHRGIRPVSWICEALGVSRSGPREGWLDVAAFIDLFPRRVVGWSMSDAMTAQLATRGARRSAASL